MREAEKRDESFFQWMFFYLYMWGVRISAFNSYLNEVVLKTENDQEKMESSTNIGNCRDKNVDRARRKTVVGLK